jgi:flagellar biosynthetic protein FliR
MKAIIDTSWLMAALMAFVRVGGVLMFTPVLGFATLPVNIRLMLVLALTVTLPSVIPAGVGADFQDLPTLGLAAIRELTLGASMAFGVTAVFASFAVGGKLLDYQMGFGIASLFDPATATQTSLIGTFLSMLGAVIFLALDAHHVLIRAIAYTFSVVPLGQPIHLAPDALVSQFGVMFTFGFMLVAPAVVTLMLLDLGMGVASRLMPQVSAYFVILPVKIFVGIAVLALSLRYMGPFMDSMFGQIETFWRHLFSQGHS